MAEVYRVLDYAKVGDSIVLLDGQGNELAPKARPVYLFFTELGNWTNSRGEKFNPQPQRHLGEIIHGNSERPTDQVVEGDDIPHVRFQEES